MNVKSLIARGTSKDIRVNKPIRYLTINTTNWRLTGEPCSGCGKEPPLVLSGVPNPLHIKVPMTDEEFEAVCQRPFWTGAKFDVECVNGLAHIIRGLANVRWLFSVCQDYTQGPYLVNEGTYEETLIKFLPYIMDIPTVSQVNWPTDANYDLVMP